MPAWDDDSPRDELLLGLLLAVVGTRFGDVGTVLAAIGFAVGVGAYLVAAFDPGSPTAREEA